MALCDHRQAIPAGLEPATSAFEARTPVGGFSWGPVSVPAGQESTKRTPFGRPQPTRPPEKTLSPQRSGNVTLVSGTSGVTAVEVRVLSWAPSEINHLWRCRRLWGARQVCPDGTVGAPLRASEARPSSALA